MAGGFKLDWATLEKIPWWGYAVAGGVGLAGFEYVKKRSGAASAPAGASPSGAQPMYQAPDGLSSADLAGLPFDYYDYSAAYNPNATSVPGSTGGTVGAGTPAPLPAITPGGAPQAGVTGGYTQGNSVVMGAAPGAPSATTGAPQAGGTGASAPASTPGPAVYTHAVEAWPAWDSTLSGIAAHYGMSWQQLYHYGNDQQTIDSAAHAHGHYGDEYNWLYPGEQLQVPRAG